MKAISISLCLGLGLFAQSALADDCIRKTEVLLSSKPVGKSSCWVEYIKIRHCTGAGAFGGGIVANAYFNLKVENRYLVIIEDVCRRAVIDRVDVTRVVQVKQGPYTNGQCAPYVVGFGGLGGAEKDAVNKLKDRAKDVCNKAKDNAY